MVTVSILGWTFSALRTRDGGCVLDGYDAKVHRQGASEVRLADLPVFGRPVRLVWRKRRWRCPDGWQALSVVASELSAGVGG